jgi:hypothetical protein
MVGGGPRLQGVMNRSFPQAPSSTNPRAASFQGGNPLSSSHASDGAQRGRKTALALIACVPNIDRALWLGATCCLVPSVCGVMGLYNRAANRQAHSHTVSLVVKSGLNIRSMSCEPMPVPVSAAQARL